MFGVFILMFVGLFILSVICYLLFTKISNRVKIENQKTELQLKKMRELQESEEKR